MLSEDWTPLSRVIGYDLPSLKNFAAVFYNRDYAPVPKVHGDEIPDWRQLGTGPQSIGYTLTPPGRALIIGGGGGRDIYNALSAGVPQVDVIELNEGIRAAVDGPLARSRRIRAQASARPLATGDRRSLSATRSTTSCISASRTR